MFFVFFLRKSFNYELFLQPNRNEEFVRHSLAQQLLFLLICGFYDGKICDAGITFLDGLSVDQRNYVS